MELLEKLAALVPPPRFQFLRYHGVLTPCARDRSPPDLCAVSGTEECALKYQVDP